MKILQHPLLAALLIGAAAIPAAATELSETLTQKPCVVEGSEGFRSTMYNPTPESEEIMALERAACWMLEQKQLAKLGNDIIDKQGLLFLDGGDILYGRDQQLAMFSKFLNTEGMFFTYEPVEAHVSESKDMAWAFGLYKLQMEGQKMETGKYTSVWQKRDGKWLNVSEMRNPFKR